MQKNTSIPPTTKAPLGIGLQMLGSVEDQGGTNHTWESELASRQKEVMRQLSATDARIKGILSSFFTWLKTNKLLHPLYNEAGKYLLQYLYTAAFPEAFERASFDELRLKTDKQVSQCYLAEIYLYLYDLYGKKSGASGLGWYEDSYYDDEDSWYDEGEDSWDDEGEDSWDDEGEDSWDDEGEDSWDDEGEDSWYDEIDTDPSDVSAPVGSRPVSANRNRPTAGATSVGSNTKKSSFDWKPLLDFGKDLLTTGISNTGNIVNSVANYKNVQNNGAYMNSLAKQQEQAQQQSYNLQQQYQQALLRNNGQPNSETEALKKQLALASGNNQNLQNQITSLGAKLSQAAGSSSIADWASSLFTSTFGGGSKTPSKQSSNSGTNSAMQSGSPMDTSKLLLYGGLGIGAIVVITLLTKNKK